MRNKAKIETCNSKTGSQGSSSQGKTKSQSSNIQSTSYLKIRCGIQIPEGENIAKKQRLEKKQQGSNQSREAIQREIFVLN
jgi:hypothetical protein